MLNLHLNILELSELSNFNEKLNFNFDSETETNVSVFLTLFIRFYRLQG